MGQFNRRDWFKAGVAGLGAIGIAPGARSEVRHTERVSSFQFDHILGTSLDVWLTGPKPSAERAETTLLDEIERLRRVFSLYDPESELSRLNRSRGPVSVSPDLAAVLRQYVRWERESTGACHSRSTALTGLWSEAEKQGRLPDTDRLAAVVRSISGPGWRLEGSVVTRSASRPFDLNALAKGYILHSAVKIVRESYSDLSAGLVNLGGDMTGWGDSPWIIGVQDPYDPADNARPLTHVRLRNAAVATSGGYQRYFTIRGQRYSHLIDPRTGFPADGVASATVLAPDSPTANILATTLCVLAPAEGLRLVARTPGAECLIVTAEGEVVRSPGFGGYEWNDDPKPIAGDTGPWPDQFQVTVHIDLPQMNNARYRRPYVAVWVEDESGKAVRTLAVWGNNPKWTKDLSDWWKVAKNDAALVKAVTRATRGPGKYDLVWDGKNDKGNPLPRGTYTVRVEVHREHGKHLRQSGKIKCEGEPDTVTLEKNDETNATVVEYKKKEPAKK